MAQRSGTLVALLIGGLSVLWTGAAFPQTGSPGQAEPTDPEGLVPAKIGEGHEDLRRSARRHRLQAEQRGLYADYSRRKLRIQQQTGLQWSLDASLLEQWGGPGGASPSLQLLAGLSVNYDVFRHEAIGAGSIQLAGTLAAYPTNQTAADTGESLGVISAINDWPLSDRQFSQLTYTHTFPGDRLAVAIGQFPFSNFDGNRYLGNQQQNFVNDVFAQNGSAAYAAAGLGAFAQWNVTRSIQLAAGLQYPNDASPNTLTVPGFGDGERAWFGYVQWTPPRNRFGFGLYSFTYYESPAQAQQPATRGWSVSAVQDLGATWALFGRANAASGYTTAIDASFALGFALNNPMGRSPTDQIAVAIGPSDPGDLPDSQAGSGSEKVVEAYWNWTLFGGLLVTPDVQLFLDPALDPARDSVWILSLRATLML